MPKESTKNKSKPVAKNFQSFEYITLRRSQLHLADYNPRVMDKHSKKKLRESLKKFGLVEPVIANQRTGNRVVGGHQRLGVMDEINGFAAESHGHGWTGLDYDVPVALLDVSEADEKALNIALNNSTMQGNWDLGLLEEMLASGVDYAAAGFERHDLQLMLSDEALQGVFAEQVKAESESVSELAEMKEAGREARREKESGVKVDGGAGEKAGEKSGNESGGSSAAGEGGGVVEGSRLEEMKDQRGKYRERQADNNESEFYVAFVFDTSQQLTELLERMGLDPNMRYQSGAALVDLVDVVEEGKAANG